MKRFSLWCAPVILLIALTPLIAQRARTPEGVAVQRDLDYVSDGHARHKLDLYVPEKSDKPLPLVLWLHGGAWRDGSKESAEALPLTRRGFAVASINYRLSHHAVFPAQIEDCKAAVRFLRANAKKYNLDPDRIGIWGASAGGHLAALMGTSSDVKELEGKLGNHLDVSSRVQAVCDWYGPTDFVEFRGLNGGRSPEVMLVGGPLNEHMDKVKALNPITHIRKDAPPFLIMHGDRDRTVPITQSELLNTALKNVGVDVTFTVVEGAAHADRHFGTARVIQQVADFFEKQLKK